MTLGSCKMWRLFWYFDTWWKYPKCPALADTLCFPVELQPVIFQNLVSLIRESTKQRQTAADSISCLCLAVRKAAPSARALCLATALYRAKAHCQHLTNEEFSALSGSFWLPACWPSTDSLLFRHRIYSKQCAVFCCEMHFLPVLQPSLLPPAQAPPKVTLKLLLKWASITWMWVRCSNLGIAPSWWINDFQASWVAP